MPNPETSRHKLPLLSVSQASKEITHNEALVRIDALLHPVVEAALSVPPSVGDIDVGKCWLVTATAQGDWAGKAGSIAIWVGGGWRFCSPTEGMRVRLTTDGLDRIFAGGAWVAPVAISNPANGAVVDAEARAAINAILDLLRISGQIT